MGDFNLISIWSGKKQASWTLPPVLHQQGSSDCLHCWAKVWFQRSRTSWFSLYSWIIQSQVLPRGISVEICGITGAALSVAALPGSVSTGWGRTSGQLLSWCLRTSRLVTCFRQESVARLVVRQKWRRGSLTPHWLCHSVLPARRAQHRGAVGADSTLHCSHNPFPYYWQCLSQKLLHFSKRYRWKSRALLFKIVVFQSLN